MKQIYLVASIIVVLLIMGGAFFLFNGTNKNTNLPNGGLSAFKAYTDFYLNETDSKTFVLDKYNIKVEYLSSSPQTIRFTVDDATKTVVIGKDEGCNILYEQKCTVQNNTKQCEQIPEKTTCKIGAIRIKDYVAFGIDSEKDSWNTTSLHIFVGVALSPAEGGEQLS